MAKPQMLEVSECAGSRRIFYVILVLRLREPRSFQLFTPCRPDFSSCPSSSLLQFGKKEMRILMVGLDAAGKTTILYKLKLGEGTKTYLSEVADARFSLSSLVLLRFEISLSHTARS